MLSLVVAVGLLTACGSSAGNTAKSSAAKSSAVLVGIIINTFPINISGLLLSCFSLIALRLLKREIKTNYLEKELENYFYNKAGIK